ncbi:MAG: heme peroxidase [Candelina submexicana]|nr:MAG: heme peroxidase [Candelina submexicana]
MATAARTFTRAVRSTPATSQLKTAKIRNARYNLQQQTFPSSRRGYASGSSPRSGGSGFLWAFGLAAAGGAGYYFYARDGSLTSAAKNAAPAAAKGPFIPQQKDYQAVYNAIAKKLEEQDDYDDGSYGPVIVRLAWHCSGTYDALTKTGGSNGATMRFAPEGDHGANAGLKAARDFLEPIKQQFPWISYSDLWTLAGVTAIQEMQGPSIPWRPGRSDHPNDTFCTPDGRLPDGSKEQSHLRAIFGRMGFDDREIVALSGAHALGRCHTDRSGFDGPWSFSPTVMSNDYFRLLMSEKWNYRKWDGPKQFQDAGSKSLMMLPTDMALIKDKEFKKHVERYAKDDQVFFNEFRDVIVKLFELGVPFQSKEEDRMTFKATA